jgi:hypothetical protein
MSAIQVGAAMRELAVTAVDLLPLLEQRHDLGLLPVQQPASGAVVLIFLSHGR